jgi:uncharacterized protein (TIGR03437 family)
MYCPILIFSAVPNASYPGPALREKHCYGKGYTTFGHPQKMKLAIIAASLFCLAFLSPRASAVTATYTNSSQNVTLTGLGGSNGVGQTRVSWGSCVFDGNNTNCTISAPYTGVGGGGTISIVLSYPGNGISPFLFNSISPGNDLVQFAPFTVAGMSVAVSLQESIGANVKFIPNVQFNFNFHYSSATCTGVAAGSCGLGQVGLTPNATITGTVSGTFDATPVIQSVISAGSYGGFSAVSPATWMEIYGTNLANVLSQTWASGDFNGNSAPTALGGTTVTIGGQPAYIDFISPGQVNAQVPSNIAAGPQPVVVSMAGGTGVAFTVTVNVTEPGLLAPAVFNLAAGQYVVALLPDGKTYILPPGVTNAVPTARAKPGNIIMFYGVGFGAVTPNIAAGQIVTQSNGFPSGTFQASFAGVPATVQFAGLVAGNVGLYQFNVVVPNVAASDTVPVTFSLGGTPGPQKLIIAIGN